jgi:hypothetical protein
MKTSKLIAALLAVLGFAGCEPEETPKPGCDPNGAYLMYGTVPCAYESKVAVPDTDEATELISPAKPKEDYENE